MNDTNFLKACIIRREIQFTIQQEWKDFFSKKTGNDITHLTRYLSHRSLYTSVRTSRVLI